MGIDTGTCDRCGNERYDEEFGACERELRCEDCMEGAGCGGCAYQADCWEDDGQPDEYTEWQDYMGGDDWDHGQYDDGGY